VSVLEAILFYKQSQESRLKTEILERENIGMRFETLKKQLDPHFLFNSLNVLSSLIQKDRKKAQEFIDEFSHVYRYTLEVIDKPVVTVEQEMDYAQSYLFLQKIRFGSAVMIEVDIDEQNRDKLLPPLAVQILLENAFKHNIATESNPLQIRIYTRNDQLIVVNSRQKRQGVGKGMGFENLKNRYNLITNRLPEVMMTQDEYIVKIPILEAE
jgi:LytS/YehU family sensor histidine kinase